MNTFLILPAKFPTNRKGLSGVKENKDEAEGTCERRPECLVGPRIETVLGSLSHSHVCPGEDWEDVPSPHQTFGVYSLPSSPSPNSPP